jgi:hypothetical protein
MTEHLGIIRRWMESPVVGTGTSEGGCTAASLKRLFQTAVPDLCNGHSPSRAILHQGPFSIRRLEQGFVSDTLRRLRGETCCLSHR